MSAVRRYLDLLLDSPTYGRDRASLITGFSIGTTGLLLNAAVLMLGLPVLLAPDSPIIRSLTSNLEFGQLLSLILLGGASVFATVLIPLRLVTVFWGPRIGRYFDQIVLSGISPLRFVIGKATSQNLFLGMILFLLLPYFVLSLTLGGVNLSVFLAGLFLVWLYCMTLALVTLWASLYLNELLAAILVIVTAMTVCVMGCFKLPFQPFLMTPFPALIHPVIAAIPELDDVSRNGFFPVFASCAVCMLGVICVSLTAISLGPLYGIIRENSTFGEVVREGDSKRKRWFRIRMHIQRSSEIAFFYENRSRWFLRNEGLIRWGLGFCGLLVLVSTTHFVFAVFLSRQLPAIGRSPMNWWIFEIHSFYLTIHGIALALAVLLFSHAKNTTYLRLPFFRGWTAEVSKLDTVAFVLFTLISTAESIATPFLIEKYIAVPIGMTIFPTNIGQNMNQGLQVDFVRIALEGSAVISVAGLVVYALQRLACLTTWMRTVTFASIAAVYSVFACFLPLFFAVVSLELQELRGIWPLQYAAPTVAAASPVTAIAILINGGLGPPFPPNISTVPFYVVHDLLLVLLLLGIRRTGSKLRGMYQAEPVRGTANG